MCSGVSYPAAPPDSNASCHAAPACAHVLPLSPSVPTPLPTASDESFVAGVNGFIALCGHGTPTSSFPDGQSPIGGLQDCQSRFDPLFTATDDLCAQFIQHAHEDPFTAGFLDGIPRSENDFGDCSHGDNPGAPALMPRW